jgi:hypothetical protein
MTNLSGTKLGLAIYFAAIAKGALAVSDNTSSPHSKLQNTLQEKKPLCPMDLDQRNYMKCEDPTRYHSPRSLIKLRSNLIFFVFFEQLHYARFYLVV